jgi:L-threonylcarbamoyladenylate synthase
VESVLGHPVAVADRGSVAAPGTLAAHYAPRARVLLVDASTAAGTAERLLAAGRAVGLLALAAPADLPSRLRVLPSPADVDEYAQVLYARLREADTLGLDDLLVVAPPAHGLGAAVADRLGRAAAAADEATP